MTKAGFRSHQTAAGALQILAIISVLLVSSAGAAANAPPFLGVSLKVANQTVPPGGTLQMQIFVTEPNPILKGNQGSKFANKLAAPLPLGLMRDGALFSPQGDVSGVAVVGSSGIQVYFSSPLNSFGMLLDSPAIALAIPVRKSAIVGQKVDLLLDPNSSAWFDPASQQYPLEVKSGALTVGGTLSISDVVPGAGIVPAGSVISIKGIGFLPGSRADVNGAIVATTQFISANEIQITLDRDFNLEGIRVRVDNPTARVSYYPYQRTVGLGRSSHALIAASYPMFSHTDWTIAFFDPVVNGSIFSGLALQNLNASTATVTLQLFSSTGVLLGTKIIPLPSNRRMARDLAEFFPGLVATGTSLQVTSDLGIRMLGLLGDDAAGTVQPIEPSLVP
jgi:hypothetical protein